MAELRRELAELSAQLGAPGVERLFTAARKRGINVTRKDVRNLAAVRGETQIFRPLPPAQGKTATHGPRDSRFMMDLLDQRVNPSAAGEKYAIILVEVFSRYMWASTIRDKKPATVAAALAPMLGEIQGSQRTIPVISTDMGNEFVLDVETLLRQRNIIHKKKTPIETNALGVLDRAMQSLQQIIAKKAARDGGDWGQLLASSVAALNSTTNEAVRDAPEDVIGDDDAAKNLQFMALKDNAAKFRHNNSLTQRRKKQLAGAGGFRRPIAARTNKFQRGYRAKYGNREEQQAAPRFGTIVEGQGKEIDIKTIQVSKRGSDDPQERFNVPSRDRERGHVEEEMLGLARGFLEDRGGNSSLATLRTHLIEVMGRESYDVTLDAAAGRNRRGGLATALMLFPEYFELTSSNRRVALVED